VLDGAETSASATAPCMDSASLASAASSCHACGKNDAKLLLAVGACVRVYARVLVLVRPNLYIYIHTCRDVWFCVLQPRVSGRCSKRAWAQGCQLPPRRRNTDTSFLGGRALALCSCIKTLQGNLTLQVCASASLICSLRAINRNWQTRGSATAPQWRSARGGGISGRPHRRRGGCRLSRKGRPTSRQLPAAAQLGKHGRCRACRVPLAPRFERRVRQQRQRI